MNFLLRSALALIFIVAIGLSSAPPGLTSSAAAADGAFSLDGEVQKGEQMVQALGITEALGPLAPIALSPFFALTMLSGASILAGTGILPDFVANNPIMGTSSVLNNGFIFAGLLLLSLATAAPKLTKVTKPFAQAVDQIEAHAGIISIVAVQLLSQLQLGETANAEQANVVLYQAGILSFTQTTLIAAFSAINIFVVNTVKFFFEVLILLSPFPGVDAAFEAANKGVAGFLVAVYVFNPWVAAGLNLLIFFLSLLIFAWAYRRAMYMKSILGDPILGWIAEAIFRCKPVTLTSSHVPRTGHAQFANPNVVLKAFAGRSFQGLKTKTRGVLVAADDGVYFVKKRFFRSPLIVKMPQDGHRIEVSKGLLSNTVRFVNDAGDSAMNILFTRRYNDIFVQVESALGAVSRGETAEGARQSAVAASKSIGAAIKGDGRDAIRAELA